MVSGQVRSDQVRPSICTQYVRVYTASVRLIYKGKVQCSDTLQGEDEVMYPLGMRLGSGNTPCFHMLRCVLETFKRYNSYVVVPMLAGTL